MVGVFVLVCWCVVVCGGVVLGLVVVGWWWCVCVGWGVVGGGICVGVDVLCVVCVVCGVVWCLCVLHIR